MAKGGSKTRSQAGNSRRTPVNTAARWLDFEQAESRVLHIQAKLHRWATGDPNRRFDDLYNLVCDPAVLLVGWTRVRRNKGARSAGIDGVAPRSVVFAEAMLGGLRAELKARVFQPVPVRERKIPKANGKSRRLGIATTRDRVVQAALKLVLEPILEADFSPCSYGFRPGRRAQDAIEEIRYLAARSYEWVLEGDIESCFDEISHSALLERVRRRVGDKRVLALVKAFLKSGILGEDGAMRDTITGTPQGGILSPLLSNVALSVLDEQFARAWEAMGDFNARAYRRRKGQATYRIVRYADDFVVMVAGTRAHAEGLREEVAAALTPMGLRLSEEKTRVAHIDEGFDFLGWRIQRHKIRALTRGSTNQPLAVLLTRINPILRGWTSYFKHGASKATFAYLGAFTWHRVLIWLRHKHKRVSWKWLRSRYLPGWRPTDGKAALLNPAAVTVNRYRYRGQRIPSPWSATGTEPP